MHRITLTADLKNGFLSLCFNLSVHGIRMGTQIQPSPAAEHHSLCSCPNINKEKNPSWDVRGDPGWKPYLAFKSHPPHRFSSAPPYSPSVFGGVPPWQGFAGTGHHQHRAPGCKLGNARDAKVWAWETSAHARMCSLIVSKTFQSFISFYYFCWWHYK